MKINSINSLNYRRISFNSKSNTKEIEKIKRDLGTQTIQNSNAEEILPYFGIQILNKDKNQKLTIDSYHQPSYSITFSKLGIDEEKMFEQIKSIQGDASFAKSQLKSLEGLEEVQGNLTIPKKMRIGSTLCSVGKRIYCSDLQSLRQEYADWRFEDRAREIIYYNSIGANSKKDLEDYRKLFY